MADGRIRVGVVGANPDRGWAARAHIPALRALPGYEITAVGTSRAASARAAADRFGVPHAFTDAAELAAHPDVDLVAITVKVPAHDALIRAALGAGKHVYCEWPLALTTAEAEGLLHLARDAGVRHAVGLQARFSPAVRYARDLVADGYVGRVTSVNVYAARGKGGAGEIPGFAAYTLDPSNGAGTLEVGAGHTLDVLEHLAGDVTALSAELAVQRTAYTVAGTDEAVKVTSPDQIAVAAVLAGGATAVVHVHDAKVTAARTRIEIAGTDGDLALVSPGPGAAAGVQIGVLALRGARGHGSPREELPIPEEYLWVPEPARGVEVLNVAQFYARFADDIRTGGRTVPGFDAGLRVHRLLDAVRLSAETGTRREVAQP
ncbi:Gfo/Idh/MocA family protein [Actinomadura montaniterrae]|uniref:Gfo/Idh/MocA family oxidoreductase n=1 Tax=Actinomadura montaniterrae TaxID=1803903 RepID=A0A6L3W297_9ACTN|nr:Gfo/Idh/MocA family oxidoreductase [Actinomadura montaniterrae]KAB2380979.1 Gfo/Idh/MocA family oxidoreductase [Actinomadura montaniterrae]